MTIFGPDISNNNGVVNIDRVADEGFDFVFAKVSEGSGFQDRFWPKTRDWCAARGLICIGYHYVKTDSADAQAQCFANNGGGNKVMFDFEANSGNMGTFWACVNAFNALGIEVVLSYIPHWYWQQIGSPDISNIPGLLIQSSYVNASGPASAIYPGDGSHFWSGFGGHDVDILQFSDKAAVAGMSLDVNAFRGSKDDLARALGLAPSAPPPNAIDEQAGVAAGWIGARLSPEKPTADGNGRFAEFENGLIYWSPDSGAWAIPKHLFESYAELGYEAGPLGYPVAAHTVLAAGDVQAFQRGVLYRKTGEPGHFITGAIGNRYRLTGYEGGPLGWPVTNEQKAGDTIWQGFEGGKIAWSPDGTILFDKAGKLA